jgi:hypothetical protein
MPPDALVPQHGHMHPELTAIVARQRYDELSSTARHIVDAAPRRGFFRRRRESALSPVSTPSQIVLLPPPREERGTTGHDQRVA